MTIETLLEKAFGFPARILQGIIDLYEKYRNSIRK